MITEKIKANKIKVGVGVAVVAVVAATYIGGTVYYSDKFIPGTSVNELDCSGKTADELKQELINRGTEYTLTIQERDNKTETISSSDIDLKVKLDSAIDDSMAAQNNFLWFTGFFSKHNIESPLEIVYDEKKFDKALKGLAAVQKGNFVKPENAKVSDYIDDKGFEVVKEVEGTQIRTKKLAKIARSYADELNPTLVLEDEELYRVPAIRSDDKDLNEVCKNMNEVLGAKVTIKFGKKKKEVVDDSVISQWLKVDEKTNEVSLDDEKVSEYMGELARKYNTIYTTHQFKTTNGEKISIENGDYGWWLNQNGTKEKIVKAVLKHKTKTIHPVWLQEAASYNRKRDYGNTYIEVDLGSQILYMYKNGKLQMSSYFVSGNPYTGHGTPGGIYSVTYVDTNKRMVGADYNVFTYYWIPFNGDIGFHDATWRSSFGGSIYLGGGSHGCVNMPLSKARELWNLAEKGMPVICYY